MHQPSNPAVIKLHSELFYSVEQGVQKGVAVAHIVWLIFQTITHEFAHYLETNVSPHLEIVLVARTLMGNQYAAGAAKLRG